MTVNEALQWGVKHLTGAEMDSPALDAEVILAHVLSVDRVELYTHPSIALLPSELKVYKTLMERRSNHEPVAYIIGHKEFYGLDFVVNRHTLIPRPETEIIVEETLRIGRTKIQKSLYVVDVGTGSGCIIVALAKILNPSSRSKAHHFFATDIFSQALKMAKLNAERHGFSQKILFRKDNLLKPILAHLEKAMSQSQLLITANLPYLPTAELRRATKEVHYEPRQALDGGKDGLMYYRHLFEQLKSWRGRQKFASITVLAEIDPHQVDEFRILAKSFFRTTRFPIRKDLAGLDRVVTVTL